MDWLGVLYRACPPEHHAVLQTVVMINLFNIFQAAVPSATAPKASAPAIVKRRQTKLDVAAKPVSAEVKQVQ